MAKLGTHKITGQSGKVYEFSVYPMNTVWAPISGVFMITHRDVAADHAVNHIHLKLGHLENLQDLNEKDAEWRGHRANSVCLLVEKNAAKRAVIVEDIGGSTAIPG